MRRYDSLVVKSQIIYCICFFSLFLLVVFVIPDYMRSLQCTEHTYATVLDREENYIGKHVVSYDYTLRLHNNSIDRTITISNCKELYYIDQQVPIEYRPDGFIYRIPTKFY